MSNDKVELNEDFGNLEQVLEERAYNAVKRGISHALSDMGLEGVENAAKPVMRARRRGRKGRNTKCNPVELTTTQKEVLKTIQEYMDEHDKSPTYSEISEALDKSGVATIVHAIEEKGWIHLDDTKFSRKIEVLNRV